KDKLKLLRGKVDKLAVKIRRGVDPVAELVVNKKDLSKEVARDEAELAKQKEGIVKLLKLLDSGEQYVTVDGKKVPATAVEKQFRGEDARYKAAEKRLQKKKETLEEMEKTLADVREEFDRLVEKHAEYKSRLTQLEAKQAVRDVATIGNPYFDKD